MSPRAEQAPAGTGRSLLVLVVIGLLAVALALLARVRPRVELLDPTSGSRTGARGLVLVLQSVGATVRTSATVPSVGDHVDRVVVLVDRLSAAQREALEKWVQGGGIAIIADPDSTVGGRDVTASRSIGTDEVDKASCSIGALDKLSTVSFVAHHTGGPDTVPGGREDGVSDARSLPVLGDDQRCFGGSSDAFVVAERDGAGIVVRLGENWIFSNELLASGDNAALGTALIAPTSSSNVVILRGTATKRTTDVTAGGDKSLLQLVPTRVWMGISGLVVAFFVFAIAAGWRVGRPVVERPPVPIAGSDLVVATGNLMRRAGHTQRAAELLRYQLHRDLCRRYSIDPLASINELDRLVSAQINDPARLAPETLVEVLRATDINTSARLVNLSEHIRQLRRETL